MKRILLSLSVLAMAYTATSQTFVSEDFNSLTVGEIGGQGSWLVFPDPLPEATVVNIGTGDNVLQLAGSATTGTKFVYQNLDFSSRTTGNDVLFSTFKFRTGLATTSLNTFDYGFFDDQFNLVFGLRYTPNTNIVEGLIYDTDGLYRVALVTGGDVTLEDDKIYTAYLWYNTAEKQAFWIIEDENDSQVCIQVTSYGSAGEIAEFDIVANSGGASNTASTNIMYDDISIVARPCLVYDTKDDATFAFSESTVCNNLTAVSPTLTDGNVTGVFTSTPAGLTIDANTGSVNASSSTIGTYTVQFASNVANTCDDSTTVSLTIQDCASLPEHLTSAFSVAPNPAQDFITVTLSDNASKGGLISLMTSEGKEVETRVVSANKEEVFNVSNLEAGIYFVKFADKIEKVVVQ